MSAQPVFRPLAVVAALAVAVLIGCGTAASDQQRAEGAAPPAAAPPPSSTPPPSTPAPPPPGFGPISSRGQVVAAPPAPAEPAADGDPLTILAPGARFTLPASWRRERPSSSMRLAQASIDGPGGPAALTVFYFGAGGGGSVDANLQRWIDQIEPVPGAPPPRRESEAVGSFQATWVEVAGTLAPSTMGTGPRKPQPGNRLLGAVVEGDQGPWFFKVTGPDATVDAARDEFIDMLRSVEAR